MSLLVLPSSGVAGSVDDWPLLVANFVKHDAPFLATLACIGPTQPDGAVSNVCPN